MNNAQNKYKPDYVSPPGETLLDTLEAIGMSQADLAERAGRPKKTINEIIKGKAAITPETALQLERVLGVPSGFWNQREHLYREFLAREAENARLRDQVEWLEKLPVKAMIKLGWIEGSKDKVTLLRQTLSFFGVATPQKWDELWRESQPAFRKSRSFKTDPGAVASWLRKGEIEARRISCDPYSETKFKEVLRQIRSLTATAPEYFQPELARLCASAGVAVVFVPELPGTRVFGATRWLTPNKAVIQLSLRYKTDDHLWFTFFHEAGHILLHGKTRLFLEDDHDRDGHEKEANRFAADMLIPERALRRFQAREDHSLEAIKNFAREIGIVPGIVVSRLQHEGLLQRSHGNKLKARVEWMITK